MFFINEHNALKTILLFEVNLITILLRLHTGNKGFFSLLSPSSSPRTFYDSGQFAFYSVFLMSHETAENSLVYSVR